jgi:hypothetical protein
MGIKEFKAIKKELEEKLQIQMSSLIADANITAEISDALDVVIIGIIKEQDKDANTKWKTENYLVYQLANPENIIFQGTNKTFLLNNRKDITGLLTNNAQVDLNTLYTLQQAVYRFCIDNELLEDKKVAGVGVDDQQK